MRVRVAAVAAVAWALLVGAGWAGEPGRPGRRDPAPLDLTAALAPVLEALSGSTAGTGDAPRLLSEALRTGTVDAAAWGAIVRWIFNERDETVAAGLAEVLRSAPSARGGAAVRWEATAGAILGAFQEVLGDAENLRRQDGEVVMRRLARAAAPAVVAALQEADPGARASALQTLRAAVAASPQLRSAIDAADPSVREALRDVLEQVQPPPAAVPPAPEPPAAPPRE